MRSRLRRRTVCLYKLRTCRCCSPHRRWPGTRFRDDQATPYSIAAAWRSATPAAVSSWSESASWAYCSRTGCRRGRSGARRAERVEPVAQMVGAVFVFDVDDVDRIGCQVAEDRPAASASRRIYCDGFYGHRNVIWRGPRTAPVGARSRPVGRATGAGWLLPVASFCVRRPVVWPGGGCVGSPRGAWSLRVDRPVRSATVSTRCR